MTEVHSFDTNILEEIKTEVTSTDTSEIKTVQKMSLRKIRYPNKRYADYYQNEGNNKSDYKISKNREKLEVPSQKFTKLKEKSVKTLSKDTLKDKFDQVETELELLFTGSNLISDNPNEKTEQDSSKNERKKRKKYTSKKWEDYVFLDQVNLASFGNFC